MRPINVLTGTPLADWVHPKEVNIPDLEKKVQNGHLLNNEIEDITQKCTKYLPDFWSGWYMLSRTSVPIPTDLGELDQLYCFRVPIQSDMNIIWSRYTWGKYHLLLGHQIYTYGKYNLLLRDKFFTN